MEYYQPWGNLSEKQAIRSKFAPGPAPNRKSGWTQTKTFGTKTCGTQSRNSGGQADDIECR